MLENRFKTRLVADLEEMFPGCFIHHLNPNETQGIPDLLILWNDRWAMLEGKKSANEPVQPNQPYYVEMFNNMSFAAFIFPENKEVVLNELQRSFSARRTTRFPFRQ